MDARTLARALGGEASGNTILCPGPGHSRRDRSLSVRLDARAPGGFIVHSFAGDDPMACRDYVRTMLCLSAFEPWRQVRSPERPDPVEEGGDRTRRALVIWHEARPIEGTPAEAYLTGRGLSYAGEALRWHPSCPFGKGVRHGCMLGLVRNLVSNEPQAIHRTAIDPDGRKLSHLGSHGRLAYGPTGGGAIKLTDDADVTLSLAIGEGIETTLSILKLPDLADMAIWAAFSAAGIAAFPALPGLQSVWIAVDNDRSGTGREASLTAATRLTASKVETVLIEPNAIGADLNDIIARTEAVQEAGR